MPVSGSTKTNPVKRALRLAQESIAWPVLGLLEDGYHVHLLSDAICSRNKHDYLAGVANAAQAGAVVSTAETVLFQMLKESTHEQFRGISKLVKERG